MSKTPKKSAKTATRKPVKKAGVKLKSAKPVADAKGSRRGFMWKALEQKQLKQKEMSTAGITSVNPEDRARFNGLRRRVG